MTTFDRALEVLEAARRPGELRIHPLDAVEALTQAGLLASDLPEKDRITPAGTSVWEPQNALVTQAFADGEVRLTVPATRISGGVFDVVYTHQSATAQAHALLAAASEYPDAKENR